MRPSPALAHPADLLIGLFIALGLLLLIAGGTAGLRWLSVRWSTACHRLVHAPTPPRFVQPWRLSVPRSEAACPPRLR